MLVMEQYARRKQQGLSKMVFKELDFVLLTILIGIMGGIANWLMSDEHTIFQFVASVFLAGFTGYLAGILCIELHYNQNVTFFVCGVSGLSAKVLLEQFRKIVISKLSGVVDIVTDAPKRRPHKNDINNDDITGDL